MLHVVEYFAKSLLEMAQFDRSHTSSYWRSIVTVDAVLYRFRDKARYWSKIGFLNPTGFLRH